MAFVSYILDPPEFTTISRHPCFIWNKKWIQITLMGEVVARLDDNGGGFPNAKYLSDISDTYPVMFYKLSSPSMVGYLADMIPNILVFLFIVGVPYLPVLWNATIIVIVF